MLGSDPSNFRSSLLPFLFSLFSPSPVQSSSLSTSLPLLLTIRPCYYRRLENLEEEIEEIAAERRRLIAELEDEKVVHSSDGKKTRSRALVWPFLSDDF